MSAFHHSNVLFVSCDDGLPLEFNVRNTNEKSILRAMIEHGGGICSQEESAVHLISPGTKVLNADLGKKLVSSRYILDCVNQNTLLDVNDYVFTITEAHTSDISDEDSDKLLLKKSVDILDLTKEQKEDSDKTDDSVVFYSLSDSTASKESYAHQGSSSSTNSESFVEGSPDANKVRKVAHALDTDTCEFVPLTSTAKEPDPNQVLEPLSSVSPIKRFQSQSIVSPHKEPNEISNNSDHEFNFNPVIAEGDPDPFGDTSLNLSANQAVSSSQPTTGELDNFDKKLMNKSQKKFESDDDEPLSQSYTVSSSADAQVASKSNSGEGHSSELFNCPSVQPDSPVQSQHFDHQSYMRDLESEVLKILEKPGPKSIQDKTILVKYICSVQKLPPKDVLKSLFQP